MNKGKLADEGLTKGFIIQKVNEEPMRTIDDLQNAVKEASSSKDAVIYIQGLYPTGKKKYIGFSLND